MENVAINRNYLESLSFSELSKIADDYGIDVPENFYRGFLIGEILEVIEDTKKITDDSDMLLSDEDVLEESQEIVPRSYNATEVELLLRNPAWAFVYWNISDADMDSLRKAFVSELKIRVSCFSEKDQIKPDEYFDFKISKKDNGQYFLLPAKRKYFRADLLFYLDGIVDILASSSVLEMPVGSEKLVDVRPGRIDGLSDVLKLSGMEQLLLDHYKNHRESFS